MKIFTILALVSLMFACGEDANNRNNGMTNNGTTNNGTTDSNNGTTAATNNGTTGVDVCQTINCAGNEPPVCDENVVVTHEGPHGCDPRTGCFRGTEVRTDCAIELKVCQVDKCVDLCENITCDSPEDFCTDNVATSYSGNGTCAFLDGTCDYSTVEVVTDCTSLGQSCVDGACVVLPPVAPTAGDLVITEILPYPTPLNEGDWFEIINVTNTPILLNDITIKDNDRYSHLITSANDIIVNPGQYFVLGSNNDMIANGGVAVDYSWGNITDFPFHRLGEIILENATGDVIDQVSFDDIYSRGVSTQLGNQHDLLAVDNDDNQFWCGGRTGFGAGDLGSPGSANEDCLPPSVVTIYDIQDPTQANHPTRDTIVDVKDVVISAINGRSFWIQESAGGEYSGIAVQVNGVLNLDLKVGDTVNLLGKYQESSSTSQILTDDASITLISSPGLSPTPEILNARIFGISPSENDEAEKWEGVLIQINEAGVTESVSQGETLFGRFRTDDALFSHTTPTPCTFFESIAGPLDTRLGKYRIQPRSAADMVVSTTPVVDQRSDTEGSIDILGILDGYSPQVLCINRTKAMVYTNLDPTLSHDAIRRDPSKVAPNNATTQVFVPLLAPNGTHRTIAHPIGTQHYRSTVYEDMEGAIIFLP